MLKYFFVIIFSSTTTLSSSLFAEGKITAYFANDSINGFQISDAYETHNMGVIYENHEHKIHVDLGIVTPDMHQYINEFREANRSYGEIVTFKYYPKFLVLGRKIDTYIQTTASGDFGLDRAQDFTHRILRLQPVGDINNKIQMPNNVWAGVGASFSQSINHNTSFKTHGYLGSNSAFVDLSATQHVGILGQSIALDAGMRGVLFDEIVNAKPIQAQPRRVIPYIRIGTSFNLLGLELSVSNTISLPTIKADESIYSRTQVSYEFEF